MTKSTLRRAAAAASSLLVAAALIAPLTAMAATHTIELEKQIIFGEPGERYSLGTFPTPAELVGQECTVAALGNNNESVHMGNNIEVTSANTVVLVGVEDAPNKDTAAAGLLLLSEQISFTLVLGEDPVYSAEFLVTLNCQPVETTTTTTTTTEPPTTTTTEPPTTTTTEPPTTTTTEPPTTTTTEPETTTTTEPPLVSSTTTVPDTTPETLPFTGVDSDELAVVAYVALAIGSGLVLLSRRSVDHR